MMRRIPAILILSALAALPSRAEEIPYLELRIYHVAKGKTDATLERFRERMAALYSRHGIQSLGYWTATNEAAGERFVYLLKAPGKTAFDASFKAFLADPEFKSAYSMAMKRHGNTVEKIESLPLKPFDWSPAFPTNFADSRRTIEFRRYEVASGRMEEYAANYRDHRLGLFKAHGLESIGFWSAPGTNNGGIFVMMAAGKSAAEISASKTAYHADPKWDQVVKPLDAKGKPTLSVESLILTPASFSPLH